MTTSSAHLLIIRFFDGVEKNVFQKDNCERIVVILQKLLYNTKAIFIYQAMTLTKDSVLWNGLPQSDNIASPTFSEKIRNPLNLSLYLHLSNMSDLILRQFKNALSHCNTVI
jgi:hypothetical protein